MGAAGGNFDIFILNKCIFKYEIGDSLSVFLKKFPPPAEVPLLKKTLRLRVQQMPVQQNLRFRAAGGGGMQNPMSSTGALRSLLATALTIFPMFRLLFSVHTILTGQGAYFKCNFCLERELDSKTRRCGELWAKKIKKLVFFDPSIKHWVDCSVLTRNLFFQKF